MKMPVKRLLLTACLLVSAAGLASADMTVTLKDGRVLTLPVQQDEIESITFGPAGAAPALPARRAADQVRDDAERARSAAEAADRAEEAVRKAEAAARAAQEAAAAARKLARQPPVRSDPPLAMRREPGAREPAAGGPRVLRVAPGGQYPAPSAAAKDARDGDVIEIQAGTYTGDAAVWLASDLDIRGVGGPVKLVADGNAAERKAIWVVKGDNTSIRNIEFSGARVPDRNGAGIRLEGTGLIVRHCRFVDNEMGLMTGRNPESDVLIEHSEFHRNTVDYARYRRLGHNVYIGAVRSFTLRHSWVHGAVTGHNVKSRAARNLILYNRIGDEDDGASSYLLDLSNGGASVLLGNVFHQGPRAENWSMVAYGAEGRNPEQSLFVASNTFVNDRGSGVFVHRHTEGETLLVNNIFSGQGRILEGDGRLLGNLIAGQGGIAGSVRGMLAGGKARPGSGALEGNLIAAEAGFVDPQKLDFRLTQGSPAIGVGESPGSGAGMSLRPVSEYRHALMAAARRGDGALDIGAFQFSGERQAR